MKINLTGEIFVTSFFLTPNVVGSLPSGKSSGSDPLSISKTIEVKYYGGSDACQGDSGGPL
jgi:hypothetical protein